MSDTYAFLEHHGILGMKWGIRRYQNKDGSLTAAGKKRYLNDDGSYNETAKKEIPLVAQSNKELQDTVTRMNLEQQYKRLTEDKQKESVINNILMNAATRFVNSVMDSFARKVDSAVNVKDPGPSLSDFSKDELDHPEKLPADRLALLVKAVTNVNYVNSHKPKT